MHSFFLRLLLAPSLLLGASGAAAQPEIPQDKWIVDWGEQRCSLVWRSGGPDGVTMVLRASLGTHRPELVLTKAGPGQPLPSLDVEVDVLLTPAAAKSTGWGQAMRADNGERILFVTNLAEDFFDQFAASREVAVQRKGRELVRISYTHAQAAIRNLRVCNDDLLASWGIDLKLLKSLQRKPVAAKNPKAWFSGGDYPESAIRNRKSGSTVVRFTIGTDGRVRDCTAVVSSGTEELDAQSCRVLTARGFYEPALDSSGQPVALRAVETVNWVISG
jgi:TonB family protein